ncbi:MAG: hypothetical protein CHACPFDD_01715 [Phycisphaerae bacterium]|nr:hypothetical protein [Phycisphaerae bacterium]
MRDSKMEVASREVVHVGLDYSTAFVQVCVLDSAGRVLANARCANSWRALDALVRRWSLDLAHPGYVQRMKQSESPCRRGYNVHMNVSARRT